ncbi:MAG: helix-turn-helix domain-containing protein [Rhizobiaceae bacterium]|nr:helix-turn-helix domain-containing protein [Rhizobiaceae bacterium]
MKARNLVKIDVDLGREIKAMRKAANRTQEQLAAHLGISRQHISNHETGRCGLKFSRLERIRAYLASPDRVGLSEEQSTFVVPPNKDLELAKRLKRLIADISALEPEVDQVILDAMRR